MVVKFKGCHKELGGKPSGPVLGGVSDVSYLVPQHIKHWQTSPHCNGVWVNGQSQTSFLPVHSNNR